MTQYNSNNIQHNSNSDTGTVSSCNSNTLSLEQLIDNFIYSKPITDSAVLHMEDPLQPLIAGQSNVTNISAGASFAISKTDGSTLVTFSAVDAIGAVDRPGTEAVSRYEIGGTVMSGMGNFGDEMGRNPRTYHLDQGNCHNGDSFGPGQTFDCSVGMLKLQISNYSGGDNRPQKQRYLHGATPTPILFLGDTRSNEHVEGTQLSLQERTSQFQLFSDQASGTFNRLEVGGPIRGSTVGLNSIPATGSIKPELALPWNQNFVAWKFLQDSKCDENLSAVSGIRDMNMRAGGDKALSFRKCMPSIKCHCASGNVASDMCNATSWEGNWNVRPESSLALGSHIAVFTNCDKIGMSVSSFGGKQEVVPKSDGGSILPAHICRSGVFCSNAATGIQNHSSNPNKTPGSAVDMAGRYCYVNQPNEVLEEPPFINHSKWI